MTLTPDQKKQLTEAAEPLMKWMAENCHPHCEAHVEVDVVYLVEGIATCRNNAFVKD